jgi:hypothetical protein
MEAYYYPIPHLIGLGIILLFRGRITEYLHSEDKKRLALGVLLCAYPSTMAGHMLGNLIFIQLFNPNALLFITLLPVSIIERVTLTAIATIIGAPLVIVMRNLFSERKS